MNAPQDGNNPDATKPPAPARPDPAQTRQLSEHKHDRPLLGCRFDPSGHFVVTGAQGNVVERWEVLTGQKVDLSGHESWVRGMAFRPGSRCLYTGDYAGHVNGWQYAAETPCPAQWSFEAHKGWVRTVSVSPDGRLLATGGNDQLIRWWSADDGKLRRELACHECHVYNSAFHPSGQHFVSVDLKGVVCHWEVPSGKLLRKLDAGVLYKYDGGFRADIGGARGIAFSPDGRYLACSGITDVTNAFAGVGNAAVVLFDWLTGQRKDLLRPEKDFQGVAWGVVFHPEGFFIGAGGGGGGGELWFWKPAEPKSFFTFKLPSAARDVDLHPDGLRLAVAHYDGMLRLYDMSTKEAESEQGKSQK